MSFLAELRAKVNSQSAGFSLGKYERPGTGSSYGIYGNLRRLEPALPPAVQAWLVVRARTGSKRANRDKQEQKPADRCRQRGEHNPR